MDWSLVLASQGIETAIEHDDSGWFLAVSEMDAEPALRAIKLYQTENRGWWWRTPSGSSLSFHPAGACWVLFLAAIHFAIAGPFPELYRHGILDSAAVAQGAWWRLFTAVTLHADAGHLVANLTTGFLFLSLAISHYRPGITLLASYLAAAAANAVAFSLYPLPHQSLGASGMVMATLGLLAVHSLAHRRPSSQTRRMLVQTAAGAFLILVLFGFSPGTDVLAHVGGFGFGALFGALLQWMPAKRASGKTLDRIAGMTFIAVVAVPWFLAARFAGGK